MSSRWARCFSAAAKNYLDRNLIRVYTFAFAFSKVRTRECERRETSMLTNRTNRFEMHAARPTTPWSPVIGASVFSSAYCLGSTPTISSVGGFLKQEQMENLNAIQANSDRRQLQM